MARPYRPRRWRTALPDPAGCWLLTRELQINPVTAQVLYNRGLTSPAAAGAFLTAGRQQILDPMLLKEMDRAVHLLRQRIASRQPIMVYGDYDVDGITGTAILVLALRSLGAVVDYYIPSRFTEGYGLNVGALQEIKARGHDFILSVDTGVSAVAEAQAARAMGITLVITDHHEPGPVLPDAAALINPKRPDCSYPFSELSGVGVAFKLALALNAPGVWDLLDIVTLGTIADMVPLVGENRAIVREGLDALSQTRRPGLRALMDIAGVRQPVTATHIGFALGPRINALGRMGSAMRGVELLLTEDAGRARELARLLDEENQSRQAVEAEILQQAMQQAEALPPALREYVLVLAGEGWHHGVVGICAARVLEAYHRPAILLSLDGEGGRGSARSIPAFHLHRALSRVSDLFVKFGGHAAAAGMTLRSRADLPALRERLNRLAAQWLQPEDLIAELRVDARIRAEQVTDQLVKELAQLQPFGIGNPQPVMALSDCSVLDSRLIGKEQNHLKLLLGGTGRPTPLEAVGWNLAPARPPAQSRVQIAFLPEYETYQGRRQLRLTVRDLQILDPVTAYPVNEAPAPQLDEAACLHWEPLAGADLTGPTDQWPRLAQPVVDARDERLEAVLQQMAAQDQEAAPAAEAAPRAEAAPAAETAPAAPAGAEEAVEEPREPTRLLYLEVLATPAGSRVLVLTASPWAAAALAEELRLALPHRRREILTWLPGQPEPQEGALVVAPHGCKAAGRYTAAALYHPPYHPAQLPPYPLHLLWRREEWQLAQAALTWPYPDRESLAQLYKLLRNGAPAGPAALAGALAGRLADALGEISGPWNRLRLEAGLRIFRELGLLDSAGRAVGSNDGGKFDLADSRQFALGLRGRALLADLGRGNWPDGPQGL